MNPDRGEHTREPAPDRATIDGARLVESIRAWGSELGFAQIGIAAAGPLRRASEGNTAR